MCFLHFSARETASIQTVNELSTGDSLEEFQADSFAAEDIIPSTEHVHRYAGANPSPAHVNTPVSGSPPVGIDDASSGDIPPDAIVDASSGANPSTALNNTLAGGRPPDAIAYGLSGVNIHPDAITNASSDANPFAFVNTLASGSLPVIADTSSGVIPPDAIAHASSGTNPSAAFVNTIASGSSPDDTVNASSGVVPADAIVDVFSAAIPPYATADVSPGVSPLDALANLPSGIIPPGGSPPVESSLYTIAQIVRESAEYCRQKGLDNNPVEILRFYQTKIIEGRMLEVDDPTHDCSEGETNQIFVNRDKVLDTGMDEIKILTNKRLTLEVQFYGEVRSNNQTQGIIDYCMYFHLNFYGLTVLIFCYFVTRWKKLHDKHLI